MAFALVWPAAASVFPAAAQNASPDRYFIERWTGFDEMIQVSQLRGFRKKDRDAFFIAPGVQGNPAAAPHASGRGCFPDRGEDHGDVQQTFLINHHELRITASIGISLYPEDGNNAETLLKNADIAMYHAKDQGRSNYQFFNAALNVRTVERIILENRLRQAIEHGELTVYYQPQVNIKTRKIVGAEALVRWKHPELGMLLPEHFIPLAEEIGLIVKIDQWVLHAVCAQIKAWQKAGYSPPFVAINLSARQFQQPDFAQMMSDALKETNMRPESLSIEITETIAMQDTELTFRNLNKLNAMGIRFSMDDFGTGYSSLSYLKKLPIHKLKIDKSFITDLVSDPEDRAIIQAVIAMAHSLKLEVVAEGVETDEQIEFLRSRDCDEMQGFLFSKPLPAGEFEKLLLSVAGKGGLAA